MPNPFFFGPKITNPQYFVGRKRELRKIFGYLNTAHTGQVQHAAVVGERRIGKSSLLFHLTQVYPQYLSAHEAYRPVYLDLQTPRCHTVQGFLIYVLEEAHLPHLGRVTLETFYAIVERAREEHGLWLVLLLDEFEKLTERPEEFDDGFYDTLRALGNNNLLGIVTASQHPLRELAEHGKLTSPFFNIFHQITLGEFSEEEAYALLDLERRSEARFTDEDCKRILEIAGRHPARLQLVASLVYEAKERGAALDWKAIAAEAKRDPAFDARLHRRTLRDRIVSAFRWGAVSLPRILGRAFLQFLGRKDIAESTAWVWGALWIALALAFLFGVLSWSALTKYIRALFDLID